MGLELDPPWRFGVWADSLALPNPAHGVAREQTYPWLTRARLRASTGRPWELALCARRLRTHRSLAELDELYQGLLCTEPLLVVLQLGVNDLWPRIYPPAVYRVLRHLPERHRRPLSRAMSRVRERLAARFPLYRDVEPREAADVLRALCEALPTGAGRLVVVGPPPSDLVVQRPHLRRCVDEHYAMLDGLGRDLGVARIDLREVLGGAGRALLEEDGIHLTIEGHGALAAELSVTIERRLGALRSSLRDRDQV